ncbi:Hypothetical predicted protein [Cloeon dipterum]|uniref:Uncharacterized protein n=1 Tax=Cloeon dipterum TaxID=197152 RepID=A0A8S1CNH9_9INSE|nr:Hypothetical predicted protein [Cloeon dipterum]
MINEFDLDFKITKNQAQARQAPGHASETAGTLLRLLIIRADQKAKLRTKKGKKGETMTNEGAGAKTILKKTSGFLTADLTKLCAKLQGDQVRESTLKINFGDLLFEAPIRLETRGTCYGRCGAGVAVYKLGSEAVVRQWRNRTESRCVARSRLPAIAFCMRSGGH